MGYESLNWDKLGFNYIKGGMKPHNLMICGFDRAAPNGARAAKVGCNYAACLTPRSAAKKTNFADCIYLASQARTETEEVDSANFFAIIGDNEFVTRKSPSLLPVITRLSLIELVQSRLGLNVVEGDVLINDLARIKEASADGTVGGDAGVLFIERINLRLCSCRRADEFRSIHP